MAIWEQVHIIGIGYTLREHIMTTTPQLHLIKGRKKILKILKMAP